jgi:hypothetical protein
MATRQLPIICGDTTCFDFDVQVMCRFASATHMGTRPVCGLYRVTKGMDQGDHQPLKEDPVRHILLRCDQCLVELK